MINGSQRYLSSQRKFNRAALAYCMTTSNLQRVYEQIISLLTIPSATCFELTGPPSATRFCKQTRKQNVTIISLNAILRFTAYNKFLAPKKLLCVFLCRLVAKLTRRPQLKSNEKVLFLISKTALCVVRCRVYNEAKDPRNTTTRFVYSASVTLF